MDFRVPDHLIARAAKPKPPDPALARADEVAATEAYARLFAPRLRRLLREVFALKGRDARDALPQALDRAAALRDNVAVGLPGDLRQSLFRRLADRQIRLEEAKMRRHAAAEEAAWKEEVSEAFLAQQIADVAEDWADHRMALQSLKNGSTEIDEHSREMGWDEARIAARQARFASDVVAARTLALAHRDPEVGHDFYRANRATVMPGLRPRLEAGLAKAREEALLQRTADAILAGEPFAPAGMAGVRPINPDPAAHLPDWLAEADRFAGWYKPGDERVRQRLHREIAGRVAAMRAAQAARERSRRNTLLAAALGADGTAPTSVRELIAGRAPHLAWAEASPELQDAVERHLALNRLGRAGYPDRTAWAAARAARALHALDPAAFHAVDFSAAGHARLHPADLVALVQLQAGAKPPPHGDIPLPRLLADITALSTRS